METQLNKFETKEHTGPGALVDIIIVFLPVFVIIPGLKPWVGADPIRNMVVIWIANILMMSLAWLVMKRRKRSWRDLGFVLGPISFRSTMTTIGLSLLVFLFGVTAFIVGPLILSGFVETPETADLTRYDFLKDNPLGLVISLLAVYIVSSFGEEMIYRAFLIDRISSLTKSLAFSVVIAVLLSSALFGIAHYEWGVLGMLQTGFMGLAMGISYVWLKRRVWVLVLAHMYMDTLLLVQMYLASNPG